MTKQIRNVITAVLLLISPAGMVRADDASDIQTVRGRMTERMKLEPSSEELKQIPQWLNRQKSDGSFSGLDYANTLVNDSWQPQMHLTRLDRFAAAYVSDGNAYSHSDAMRKAAMPGVPGFPGEQSRHEISRVNRHRVTGLRPILSAICVAPELTQS